MSLFYRGLVKELRPGNVVTGLYIGLRPDDHGAKFSPSKDNVESSKQVAIEDVSSDTRWNNDVVNWRIHNFYCAMSLIL